MPSLLEQINRPRPAVTLYSPGRLVPGTAVNARAMPLPPPPISASSGRRSPFPVGSGQHQLATAGSSPWANLVGQVQQQSQQEEEAKAAEPVDLPWWKQGLGVVFGNRVAKALMYPLKPLAYPGRAVVSTVDELADLATTALGQDKSGQMHFSPAEWWHQINDPEYGFGNVVEEASRASSPEGKSDLPHWAKVLAGIGGDVALDPLTYSGFGGVKAVEGAEHAEKAAQVAAKINALEAVEQSGRVAAQLGDHALATRLGSDAASLRDDVTRLANERAAIPLKEVRLHPGMKSRMAEVSTLAERDPELVAKLGSEIPKVIEKGYVHAGPELRQALGLLPDTVRFKGVPVPGTEAMARFLGKSLGEVRGQLHRLPVDIGSLRAAEGTEKAYRTLARQSGEIDPLRATTQIHFTNVMKQGREFQGLAHSEATKLVRETLAKQGKEATAKMLREAETLSTPNEINDFFKKIPTLYRQVTGRTLEPFLRDADTYVPHMMTRKFKRFLKANADNQSVADFINKGKFMQEDLLEGSGNLERARFLTPKGGKPTTFDIGGARVTLTDGSIDELNTELTQAFPEFKGKFYEDDPRRLIEAYVSSLTKQAGRDLALQRAAASGNPLVEQVVGDLATALNKRNAVLRAQNPVLDVIREGHKPGETPRPVGVAPEMPDEVAGVKLDDYFRSTEARKESEQMMEDIYNKGPDYKKALVEDIQGTRQGVFDAAEAMRTKLRDGLDSLGTVTKDAVTAVDANIRDIVKQVKTLGEINTGNAEEIAATMAHIGVRRDEIQAAIDQVRATYATKIPAEVAAEVKRMEEMISSLNASARKIDGVLARTPRRMGLEVKRRVAALQAPVKAARDAVKVAESKVAGRVDPAVLSEALGTFRSGLNNNEAYEAAINQFRDAINGVPIEHTAQGKLTPQSIDAVHEAVARERLHPLGEQGAMAPPLPEWKPVERPPGEPYVSEWRKTKLGGRYMVTNQDGWEVHAVRSATTPYEITGYAPWYPHPDRNWTIGKRFATRAEAQAAVDEFMTEAGRARVVDVHGTSAPFPADYPGFELPTRKGRQLTKAEKAQLAEITQLKREPRVEPGGTFTEMPTETQRTLAAGSGRSGSMPGALAPGARSPYDEAQARLAELRAQAAAETDEATKKALTTEANKLQRQFHKNGPFGEEKAARDQIIKHLEWRERVEKNPDVQARRQDLINAEKAKDRQVEAAVYVQRQGQEPYRVLDPSAGFGPGEKRIIEPVTVPKAGYHTPQQMEEDVARRAALNEPRPPEVTPRLVSREGVAPSPIKLLPEDQAQLDELQRQANVTGDIVNAARSGAKGQGGLTDERFALLQDLWVNQRNEMRRFEKEAQQRAGLAARGGAPEPVAAAAAAPRSAEATEILSMHPQGSDGWYAATRSILDDDLGGTLDESSFDLVDQIHHLSNTDTDTFVAQAWDSMSEGGRQRLRDLGWPDPATAEQTALPSAVQEAGQVLGPEGAQLAAAGSVDEQLVREARKSNFTELSTAWDQVTEILNKPGELDSEQLRVLDQARTNLRRQLDQTFNEITRGTKAATSGSPLDSLRARYGLDNLARIMEKEPKAYARLLRLEGAQQKLVRQAEELQTKLDSAATTASEARTLRQQATSVQRQIDLNQAEQRNMFGISATPTRGRRAAPAAAREIGPVGVSKFPEVPGKPLATRAYVESQQQFLPNPAFVEAQQKGLIPEGAVAPPGADDEAMAAAAKMRRDAGVPEPKMVYEPQTEQQAIEALNTASMTWQGGPREQTMRARSQSMHAEAAQTAERIASGDVEAQVAAHVMAEADVANQEATERLSMLDELGTAVDDKQKLIDQRAQVKASKAKLISPKQRNVEMVDVIDSLDAVAKDNPGLLDQPMAIVEAELQAHRASLERAALMDLRWKEVEGFLGRANKRNFARQQITTVGSNWSMVYKSAFKGETPILKEGDYIVDKALHQMFRNLYNIQTESNKFGRLFSSLTNLFKTYATLSPGFHVRNALSAIFMNTADGVSLSRQIEGVRLWRRWMKGGTTWLDAQPQHIQEAFKATFASGAGGYFREAGFAESTRMERAMGNRVVRLSQRAGERVEGSVRLGMALDSVIGGDSVESAVERLARVHFDYSEVSKFDKAAKQYIPFWTFISRNLPLQITQMWMRPKTYLQYNHMVNNVATPNDPFTPEYWLDNGAWNTGGHVPDVPGMGGAQGLPIYAQPDFGFTRVQADITNMTNALTLKDPMKALSELNPLITAPLEFATKRNLYTGQAYDETSFSKQPGLLGLPARILGAIVPGQTNEAGQVSDAFTNMINSVNPLMDRSTRLLPQLGGSFDKQRQLEAYARFVGVPVRTLTPKQQSSEYWKRYFDAQREHKRQLAMAKAG